MSTYTKSEVDSMVSNLIALIKTATGTLNTTKNVISSHNAALDAHNVIISKKAALSTVTGLSTTVDDLTERIINLGIENKPSLDGTLNYSLFGKAGETDVSITFDIEPIDENNPVTYETYGDGTLIAGLTFDAAAGTISGQPTVGGSASYTVLAKSGRHCVFITILQSFENADYTPSPGSESLNELISVLRSSDISSLSGKLGVPIRITMADDTEDTARTLRYNSYTYTRAPSSDITDSDGEVTLFAWSYSRSTIYTSEIAIFGEDVGKKTDITGTGEPIKNSSGDVIGTLEKTPSYMREYRVMMTSYDTDVISDSNKPDGYAHNARMEFLDVVGTRVYDSGNGTIYEPSDIRAYLTSTAADGFLRRLPVDIRNIIVPTDIACVKTSSNAAVKRLTDKVFLPSAWELCGTRESGDWYVEGTRSLYYPLRYTESDTRIRYTSRGGSAVYWLTRSPHIDNSEYIDHSVHVICVTDEGRISAYVDASDSSGRGIAPAFVIA